jgi:hypothetical protein
MRTHEGAKKHSFNRLAQFTTRMLHIRCKEIELRSPSLFQIGFITPTRSHEAEERIEEQVENLHDKEQQRVVPSQAVLGLQSSMAILSKLSFT